VRGEQSEDDAIYRRVIVGKVGQKSVNQHLQDQSRAVHLDLLREWSEREWTAECVKGRARCAEGMTKQ
jgi:hypothetical protein